MLEQLETLTKNYNRIQEKIDEIFESKELHIKQISDLERYIEMQKEIVISIVSIKGTL